MCYLGFAVRRVRNQPLNINISKGSSLHGSALGSVPWGCVGFGGNGMLIIFGWLTVSSCKFYACFALSGYSRTHSLIRSLICVVCVLCRDLYQPRSSELSSRSHRHDSQCLRCPTRRILHDEYQHACSDCGDYGDMWGVDGVL